MKLYDDPAEFPARYDRVLAFVRHVLRTDWDPVGVGHLPQCYDEYDSYAPGLASMLMNGVAEAALHERLTGVLTHMGLNESDQAARLPALIQALRNGARRAADGPHG